MGEREGLGIGLTLTKIAGAMVFALSTAAAQVRSPSILDPAAEPASEIFDLSWLVTVICAVIFVIVAGLLIYGIVRYRERPEPDELLRRIDQLR